MKKWMRISFTLAAALSTGIVTQAASQVIAAGVPPEAMADNVRATLLPSGELTIVGSEQLYNHPDMNAASGLFLSPQTIVPLGFSAETGFYLISTWAGDLWICPTQGVLEGIEPLDKEIVLDSPVYLFDAPVLGLNSGQTASGTVQAFEKWRNWYHIRTESGDKWIHFAYALPQRLRPSNEPITLPDKASLYQYPYGLSGELTVIDPQTILPVEQGEGWYHLRGDFGDGWVYISQNENERDGDNSLPVGKTKAIELARQRLGLSDEYILKEAHLVRLNGGENRWSISFHKIRGDFTTDATQIILSASDGSVDWFSKQDTVSVQGLSAKAQDPAAMKNLAESFIYERSPVPDASWTPDEIPSNPLLQNRRNRIEGAAHSFRYIRTVNGLPYPDNHMTVTVFPDRNEISYNLIWGDNKQFEAPEGLMTKEEAELAFADAFLANAVYMAPEASKGTMSPAYAVIPRLYDTLDAKNGKWHYSSGHTEVSGPVTLRPVAAAPAENLNLSLDQAVDFARKNLGLRENFQVENAHQGNNSWLFQLNDPEQSADGAASYFLEVSTITGDLLKCYADRREYFSWLTVPYVTKAQAQASAEQALKQLLPAYTHQLYLVGSELRLTDGNIVSNPEYQFIYQRRIDGIRGDRQELILTVSAVSGNWLSIQNQMTPSIYPQSKPSFLPKDEIRKLMFSRYRVEAYYAGGDEPLTHPSKAIRYRLVPTNASAYTSFLDVQSGIWRHFLTLEPEQPGYVKQTE